MKNLNRNLNLKPEYTSYGSRKISENEFTRMLEPLLERGAAYACSILKSREDAEDALQEAVIKAYLNFERYLPSYSFKSWLFAILRNSCMDQFRKRKNTQTINFNDPSLSLAAKDDHAILERKNEIAWALSRIPPDHREILELKYFADLSYKEIAEILGIPGGTVMSRLHSARLKMAEILGKETK